MTDFVIGCPIRNRSWILSQWVDHVFAASEEAGVEPSFAFVLGESDDDTNERIIELVNSKVLPGEWIKVVEEPRKSKTKERDWNLERYKHMVFLRNTLLGLVRQMEPRYFLSLDSDILMHQFGIRNLLESIEKFDAVGGKAYLHPRERRYPTYGKLVRHSIQRPDSDGVFSTQILMAIKLMTPAAYNIDYEYDSKGEDIGWSLACKRAGLKLGWDGRVTNKHVMLRNLVDKVDDRSGF